MNKYVEPFLANPDPAERDLPEVCPRWVVVQGVVRLDKAFQVLQRVFLAGQLGCRLC